MWKYISWSFLIIIALLILIPTYSYLGSIDWSKKHSAKVASLPLFKSSDNTGLYRLPVGEFEFLMRGAGLQNDGSGVILLHGFPESSIMWEALLEKAAASGYRVLAFDQRGYSPRARPKNVSDYHINKLTQDVLEVADKVGFESFHLVGNDWGAVVGWNLAMNHADRLLSWTALSIPHSGVFFDAVLNHPEQRERSSYIKRLQRPFLPEYTFLANNQKFFKQMMGKLPKNQLEEYVALQAEYGATTATINWYRALNVKKIVDDQTFKKPINTPTLFIWGTADNVIAPAIIPNQKALIVAPYREVSLATGHAIIQTKEDTVINEIITHFNKNMESIN